METDMILLIVASLFMVFGVIGCIAPFLPGPPLSYMGLLVLHFTDKVQFSDSFLILWLIIVALTSIVEYFIPIWGAKRFGGTSAGMWGSVIGLLVGGILLPGFGFLIGAVLGAFLGELMVHKTDVNLAMKSALGALIGFVLSTALKLCVCMIMAFYFAKEIIASFAA